MKRILNEEKLFFTPLYQTEIVLANDLMHSGFIEKLNFIPRDVAGGEQTDNFNSLQHKELKEFFYEIKLYVNEISKLWGIERPLKLINYWINLDKKYSYVNYHYHPEGIISGVYYINSPKSCGNILFERADAQAHYFEAENVNEYSWKYYSIVPVKNKVIFFPSYLPHRTLQNITEDVDDRRISLSFNFSY